MPTSARSPTRRAWRAKLEARAGIVEHGLFIGMARDVVVAGGDGVRHLRKG